MTSRQVQWRRFPFFDKDTIAEDITVELGGADVCCMHTAGGRLYLGEFRFHSAGLPERDCLRYLILYEWVRVEVFAVSVLFIRSNAAR